MLKIFCIIIGIISAIIGIILLTPEVEYYRSPIKDAEGIFCIVVGIFIAILGIAGL